MAKYNNTTNRFTAGSNDWLIKFAHLTRKSAVLHPSIFAMYKKVPNKIPSFGILFSASRRRSTIIFYNPLTQPPPTTSIYTYIHIHIEHKHPSYEILKDVVIAITPSWFRLLISCGSGTQYARQGDDLGSRRLLLDWHVIEQASKSDLYVPRRRKRWRSRRSSGRTIVDVVHKFSTAVDSPITTTNSICTRQDSLPKCLL